eukprot:GFUD01002113.1.p1 GENE.GFUD01002113.1~~GFUD01002113.1.p1  ORF type:complete len:839 (-),score=120.69 GFUD01002113.1:119-2635(-)
MRSLVILTLLQAFLVPAMNISKCCPESHFLDTKTKECHLERSNVIGSRLIIKIISKDPNNSLSESEQSVNYTKIPLKPIKQCDKSLRNNSPLIIHSFSLINGPDKTRVLNKVGYPQLFDQFCLDLSSDTRTPVVQTCLPCTTDKPCINYCCPAGQVTNGRGDCVEGELGSYHWNTGINHTPVNLKLNCLKPFEYPTFKLTDTGEMEVDEKLRDPSEYCITHGDKTTTLLLCSEEDGMDLKHIFKMILMILSLVSILVLIIVHISIEEIRKQHFTKLKISFYACILLSFLSIIITTLHDFKNSFSVCVFWALLIQYSSLAIFFWLTCMSLDIWLTFNKLENPLQNPARREARLKRRLRSFFIFAFGSPLLITLVTLILQLSYEQEDAPYTHPGIGNMSCFFQEDLPLFLYFHMILLILLSINFVFYLIMVFKFTCGVWRDSHFEKTQMRNCRVLTELVFLMGINWLSESVTFFVSWLAGKHWDFPLLVFLSSINWSIGIFMLLLFFSKKVSRKMIKNLIDGTADNLDSHRTVSTQDSNRDEGYELSASNDQLIESAILGTSNLAVKAAQTLNIWGYKDNNGPAKWDEWFPISSSGTRQSPIDIIENSCVQESGLTPLHFNYKTEICQTIENDGNTWKVTEDSNLSSVCGGPLECEYRLVQYHGHWGSKPGQGSEHQVNGALYDGELHLVHYNRKYGSLGQALDWPDGLAVVAVLLKIGKHHEEFSKLCMILNHVQRKGLQRDISLLNLSPINFLPQNQSYFTYPGSLTTPPLTECVTWLVFKEPVEISHQQMNAMRSLNLSKPEEEEDKILNNYRPTKPLGDRKVKFYKVDGQILNQQA